ncbi:MAG TPA: hypothetical protein VID19_08635 [Candidatus Eremiobacteraceae bacterium]|jgi:hypothetical protein
MMPSAFLLSDALGWSAVVLLIAAVALPYLLRPTAFARALGVAGSFTGALVERMRPHAWLGYAIIALSGLHAIAGLRGGLRGIDAAGLWFAMIAFVLLCAQWLLGSRLMQRALEPRKRLRRWHFGAMVGACAAIFAHAFLNGALLRTSIP